MKYKLEIEADTMDELLGLFKNLKDRPINELPKPSKVTLEVGDAKPTASEDATPQPQEPEKPAITLAEVKRKFKEKGAGNKAHMREILAHYNAKRVSDLKPEDYENVMQELDLVEEA